MNNIYIYIYMNILSLEGGGVLGLSQALILEALEQTTGQPCCKMFNLITGTSVGSIIGACLSIGIPARQITTFFTEDAIQIFKTNIFNNIASVFRPKYNASTLEQILQARLGKLTLKDCKTKFLATAYNFTTNKVVYFKSYEPSIETDTYIVIGYDSPICLWEVCRASSAAQTYFNGYSWNNQVLIDGGNTSSNNPSTLSLCETLYSDIPLKDIQMLSLGNGNTIWQETPTAMLSPSLLSAAINTINLLFSAGEDTVSYETSRILKNNNYYWLSPTFNTTIQIDDPVTANSVIPDAVKPLILSSLSTVFPKFAI